MRRFSAVCFLVFISVYGFAQQNIPEKIIGRIPGPDSAGYYLIQVGAFKISVNAEIAVSRLKNAGLNPSTEMYLDFTRVMVRRIPASLIISQLEKLKGLGYNEVYIREDAVPITISEKWEIDSPDSMYSSFEFNHDHNYIVVENNSEGGIRFGEYNMPDRNTINLNELGIVKIENDTNNNVNFSFSPADEPQRRINFNAAKAETIPQSSQLDLLCRTWKVINCTDTGYIGYLLFISNAGTYFFSEPGGEANSLSQWRWSDEIIEAFEYTHDNWEHYGRADIIELKNDSLKILDPGFYTNIPGYSRGNFNNHWECIPVNY